VKSCFAKKDKLDDVELLINTLTELEASVTAISGNPSLFKSTMTIFRGLDTVVNDVLVKSEADDTAPVELVFSKMSTAAPP